jgi:superfamily II DNA helicase RecQ
MGAGKTLTFWMPLLFRPNGIQIVVTPLNILGQQNINTLVKAGVKGIFISAKTATKRNFEVSYYEYHLWLFDEDILLQDIASFKYCVVVINPEELMRPEGGFQALLKNQHFTDTIISFIINEAHCLTQWGSFRPDYHHVGSLRHVQ